MYAATLLLNAAPNIFIAKFYSQLRKLLGHERFGKIVPVIPKNCIVSFTNGAFKSHASN